VPLCAAWGLAVRAAYANWSWPEYLAGQQTVRAIEAYLAADSAASRPLLDFCDPSRVFTTSSSCGSCRAARRRACPQGRRGGGEDGVKNGAGNPPEPEEAGHAPETEEIEEIESGR
jgi:hypothetical protein